MRVWSRESQGEMRDWVVKRGESNINTNNTAKENKSSELGGILRNKRKTNIREQ